MASVSFVDVTRVLSESNFLLRGFDEDARVSLERPNRKSIDQWVRAFFGDLTDESNKLDGLIYERLSELVLARSCDAIDVDDIDTLVDSAGLTASDLVQVWHWCLDQLDTEFD